MNFASTDLARCRTELERISGEWFEAEDAARQYENYRDIFMQERAEVEAADLEIDLLRATRDYLLSVSTLR